MNRIFISISFLAVTLFAQAQTKDTAFLQTKKEKTEMGAAQQQRMDMEQKQLMGAPEILMKEKVVLKRNSRKQCCNTEKCKKVS